MLVVEDQDGVRDLVVRILDDHGYTVTAAGDGPSALHLVDRQRFDLLLTDVIMPTMPGPTLTKLLQQCQTQLPMLFMSGYTEGLLGERRVGERPIRPPSSTPRGYGLGYQGILHKERKGSLGSRVNG
ncbi:response regulator [Amorphoplanes digitatis]|uniref:CheY-like chemotaxis protein n=1 Tax=Actinoplanes digitatis TaxID=1868 RepID=A0A7W7I290_9ACTN|nr:response regulator [Actinoplanes digitatis]MBB4765060.1 CheY-like chemotaxis protein [Actinoplanes digitatis]BFE74766.1 hypothetical protein GCM10020092_080670 [Actinoplanes digitatis]GID97626.1 hypothetical protein Adi01nite_70380 [Actinoplanes digitatis]